MNSREQVEAVNRMQEYIKEHLRDEITLYDLARSAGYSPFHCAKLFKKYTGKTPFDYIRNLRLSQAALILRDEEKPVIDVALDFVFKSHEGFTRAFSREFGINPKQYAQRTPPIQLFIPYSVLDYYKFLERGGNAMNKATKITPIFVQVIEKPKRKVILKRAKKAEDYFQYCEELGCDIWGILTSVKDALYEPMGMWLPGSMIPTGTSRYVMGVEVADDYTGEIPEGFDLVDMPPCKMMIFQGPPFKDEDFSEAIGDLWKVIQEYDPTLYGFEWADEDGPRFQLEPQGYRGYIEGKPVRLIKK